MIGVEVAARGFAFASAMLLFGASLFLVYAPREAFRTTGNARADEWRSLRRAVRRMQLVCVVAAIVSSVAWLIVHAAVIGGEPVARALSSRTFVTVTEKTLFGRAAAFRLGLMLLLGGVVAWRLRARGAETRGIEIANAALAAAMLVTMAWMGHGVATSGPGGQIHLGADVAHLLAAGAWVGGLPPLALTLARAAGAVPVPAEIAAETTNRFSSVGILCVAVLLLSGTINAWFLVQRPAALFGTLYGQLLLVKLALFVVMLALAAANRFQLMPRLVTTSTCGDVSRRNAALRRLARNASIEMALGVAIAIVVGALGAMVPAAHMSMVMPNLPASDAHVH